MKRKEEIRQEAHRKYPYEGGTKGMICEFSIPIFIQGAEWADKTMIERLHKLKSNYEKDLDAEPRVYERDIQLCAKISLIERLIFELMEE